MYSKPTEYAIRALTWMASQGGKEAHFTAKRIAESEGLPRPILAKTLQLLAQRRLIGSRKGPGGGFRLGRDPRKISLLDVVEALEGTDLTSRCAAGLTKCRDGALCPLHGHWAPLGEHVLRYLRSTSLEQMRRALAEKRGGAGKKETPRG